jgi:dipeptidyl aminopeptidase/acylaminoacyl peptidase
MVEPIEAPYGSWVSPITSDLIVKDSIKLSQAKLVSGILYWVESRPNEAGRCVLVRRLPTGMIEDITPEPFSVRSRVHEYGGGAYTVGDGFIIFSNDLDQRLYIQKFGDEPVALSPERLLRYADGVLDIARTRIIVVCEDHTNEGTEPANSIVSLDLGSGRLDILASGYDFYSSPCLDPEGSTLAWLCWNHPNMPWDGTELRKAAIDSTGGLEDSHLVGGGEDESIFQPLWAPDGALHFVSDRTGWWNLYRSIEGKTLPLLKIEAEFGLPQWAFGMSTFGFLSEGQLIATYTQDGTWKLACLNSGGMSEFNIPHMSISSVSAEGNQIAFIGGSPTQPGAVTLLNTTTGEFESVRSSAKVDVSDGYLSVPESVWFPTQADRLAHGFYYPPSNESYIPPQEELPPLLVMSHGGPTGATTSELSLNVQYWTSRGLAVMDINYGGSTGFGKAYRARLDREWGAVDVDDCVNGAQFLVDSGKVDGNRLAIKGGSAGGYTTLSVLTFRSQFCAGASYYGISDLEALAKETHKFESRYTDRLVGPLPDDRAVYLDRSPIHHSECLSVPVIFFQGSEDLVVQPNQAERMVRALREKGVPVAYILFQGEQHGFRRAENMKRAIEAELYFYSRVLGFDLTEEIPPVHIENVD